ncbi:MAG: succinate dehydrogenase, cytochrome b556 subunit [Alphaproteobacteria bacterium]|nr:succinate dehydrogenase, cytochrome b556 subunit [Alphaproteobacteria bacterium]
MAGAGRPAARPLSPHLQIWRWHVTMASSIFHRFSGVGLYLGAAGLAIWLMALASGPQAYAPAEALLTSWIGMAALYLVFASLAYHWANGVRHLLWDTGAHLNPKAASGSAWLAILFALVAPAALFAVLNLGA